MGLITPTAGRDPGVRPQDPSRGRRSFPGSAVSSRAPGSCRTCPARPTSTCTGRPPAGRPSDAHMAEALEIAGLGNADRPPGPDLLAGHAAAAGHRPGDARPAGPAADGRADQRARPAADPRHARGAAPLRRDRPHGAGVQPPAVRGRADLQPRRRRASGPDHRVRNGGRAGVLVRRDDASTSTTGRPRRGCCGPWPATSS